jgi:hypothetical protein
MDKIAQEYRDLRGSGYGIVETHMILTERHGITEDVLIARLAAEADKGEALPPYLGGTW